MTDDPILTLGDVLEEIRRERNPRTGEAHWEFEARMNEINERALKNYRRLRDLVVELGTGEAPDHEVRRRLRQEADSILLHKAAYAVWLKEYRAQFAPAASTGASVGP